jgi:DNA ligase-1
MFRRPMLAASTKSEDLSRLPFPMLASPKIDGVRALVVDGVLVSRTLKPIPNKHVQALFGRAEYEGLDGELTVGPSNDHNVMQATMSGVMSEDGEPNVMWNVFDLWTAAPAPFASRFADARPRK